MSLRATIYDDFNTLPADDWRAVVGDDLAMNLRLLGAFQRTMTEQCRCWGVILRDLSQTPVAAACLCLFKVDALDTTSPFVTKLAGAVRTIWPGFLGFNVLFCGLPVPSGASHIRFKDAVDAGAVVHTIDRLMRDLAGKHRARLLVFKELNEANVARLDVLHSLGYALGEVPPSHLLADLSFASFDEYCAALQARYRQQINVSRRKLAVGTLESETLTGSAIAEAMTDEVHKLYLAVWERARYRLEVLPAEFFREIGRAFGDDASLTVVRSSGRVVAFVFGLAEGHVHHNLFAGIDYSMNGDADLYFNVTFHDIDYALRRGATTVHLGQTSDEFKSRIGSRQEPLWFRARAQSPILNAALRAFSKWVFPPVARVPSRQVFKSTPTAAAR